MVKAASFVLVLLLMVGLVQSRLVRQEATDLISDGIDHVNQTAFLLLELPTSSEICKPTYGFLPCTTSLWGQVFLIVVYEYLLFVGENYISAGSELIFKILGPGVFGASAFHILGSLPEAVVLLVPSLFGSKETAQERVIVGMGLLAGSAIMLLTLLWGTCVAVGKYDLSDSSTKLTFKDTRRLSLTGSGVVTDLETSLTARIMLLSLIPFIIVQLPTLFRLSSVMRPAIIVALFVAIAFLFIYCFYQVFTPWIQKRRLEFLMRKYVQDNLLEKLLTDDGSPNTTVIRELFQKIDQSKDGLISAAELRSLIIGLQFEKIDLIKDSFLVEVMKEFDATGDAHIDESEFIRGISKSLSEVKHSIDHRGHHRQNFLRNLSQGNTQKTGEEQDMLVDQQDKDVKDVDGVLWLYFKPAYLLLVGTVILAILAEPLIDTFQDFSKAANIPSFYISFILLPLAMNHREAVSAITSAREKKRNSTSLTFSEIYSAVFMNNIVDLAIFLAIVYVRGLTWDFSAEVLVVLLICAVMGLFASFYTTYPLWTCIVAYLLYPFSLGLVYVLTYTLGFS